MGKSRMYYQNLLEESIEEGFQNGEITDQDSCDIWVYDFIETQCIYTRDNWEICSSLNLTEFGSCDNIVSLAYEAWREIYSKSYDEYADEFLRLDIPSEITLDGFTWKFQQGDDYYECRSLNYGFDCDGDLIIDPLLEKSAMALESKLRGLGFETMRDSSEKGWMEVMITNL